MTPFDLITVNFKGRSIAARPIEWNRQPVNAAGDDEDGVPISPVKYVTTCPWCAQLVIFIVNDIMTGIDGPNVKCTSCGAVSENVHQSVDVVIEPVVKELVDPFIDPIAYNLISVENFEL